MPVLALELQGIYSETITHGPKWLNSTFGISEILLSPLGYCCCSAMESPEGCKPIPYLRIGKLIRRFTIYSFQSWICSFPLDFEITEFQAVNPPITSSIRFSMLMLWRTRVPRSTITIAGITIWSRWLNLCY